MVFIVNDSGTGIKDADKNAIFKILNENYQVQEGGGSNQMGIDLYISKQIVLKFGGELDFISTQNKGSTFIFSFDMEVDNLEQQIEERSIELQSHLNDMPEPNNENRQSSGSVQSPRFAQNITDNQQSFN